VVVMVVRMGMVGVVVMVVMRLVRCLICVGERVGRKANLVEHAWAIVNRLVVMMVMMMRMHMMVVMISVGIGPGAFAATLTVWCCRAIQSLILVSVSAVSLASSCTVLIAVPALDFGHCSTHQISAFDELSRAHS
jgi:hypothetical protein